MRDSAATGPITWPKALGLLRQCKATAVEQLHSRRVVLTLRHGNKVYSREPAIDDVIHELNRIGKRCGPIQLATE